MACVGFISAATVLCLRAYAVWPSTKFIKWLLASIYTISFSVSVYAIWAYESGITFDNEPPGHPERCLTLINNNKIWIAILALTLCDAVALSLILTKSLCNFRFSKSGLLMVMAKDGIGYFACVVAISITNIIVLRTAHPVIRDIVVPTQAAFQNALCVRLLLHLHVASEPRDDTTSTITHEIVFKEMYSSSGETTLT